MSASTAVQGQVGRGARRVVITGYGALCSLGLSAQEIWDAIVAGRLGYARRELEDERVKARFFGFIDEPARLEARCREARLPRALLRQLPEFARLALLAGREALDQALGGRPAGEVYAPLRCGVVIGTGWGGLDSANANSASYRRSRLASPFSTLMSMGNAATAAASQCFGLRGYQSTPVAACASGAIAVGEAAQLVRRGAADLVLAGGGESLREIFNVWSIDVLDALSKEREDPRRACCPFDLGRSGFVLSEGAAVLCLEEREAALRRGAPILGEVEGYGNCSDAHDLTAPAPDHAARVGAIAEALREAGRRPEEIDYVNAHGTSTPLNDLDESEALKLALGEHARRVPISSTKSYTGHLVGAAGALETILCLQAMAAELVPATANLLRPDPRCDLDHVPGAHRRARIGACLNLSFGFGGANAALVLGRGQEAP